MSEAADPRAIVFVRYNSNTQFSVPVTVTSSVAYIKQAVADQHGVSTDGLKIIFAGRELGDSLTLADCQIETQSILHAVSDGKRLRQPGVPALPSLKLVHEGQVEGEEVLSSPTRPDGAAGKSAQAKFYVFCKQSTCQGVVHGKLRVRCLLCKDGAFVLQQDPGCWDDVKVKGKIKGRCNKAGCSGDTAEFYFKCARHPAEVDETCVALDLLQTNIYGLPCITCGDESSSIDEMVVVFACDASHIMCVDCFRQYAIVKLNNIGFQIGPEGHYTIPCPAPTCRNSFVSEIHHFRLLGDAEYERYQRFGTEAFILSQGGIFCPNVKCAGLISLEHNYRRVECPYCHLDFCKLCRLRHHQGECNEAEAAAQQPTRAAEERSEYIVSEENAESAALSRRLIRDTSKPCPNCQVKIEKNGGCMHMTCVQCRYEWCWICNTAWSRSCQNNHWFGPR